MVILPVGLCISHVTGDKHKSSELRGHLRRIDIPDLPFEYIGLPRNFVLDVFCLGYNLEFSMDVLVGPDAEPIIAPPAGPGQPATPDAGRRSERR